LSASEGPPATLLVVCTANVCRSPLAQRTLESGFAGSGWLAEVASLSAGTRAEEGWAMCAVSATQLPGDAGDLAFAEAHRSHLLSKESVERAGLVIAMEREQRSAIAQLAPGSQAKVYTLREVESLADVLLQRGAEPVADLPALARALHSVRGFAPVPPEPPRRRWFQRAVEPDDPLTIVDGHGLADDRHLAAAVAVRATAARVAESLRRVAGGG
jgi:protein-tyrosine phosphatase